MGVKDKLKQTIIGIIDSKLAECVYPRLEAIENKLTEVQVRIDTIENKLAEVRVGIDILENDISDTRHSIIEQETELKNQKSEIVDVKEQIIKSDNRISLLEVNIRGNNQRLDWLDGAKEELQNRIDMYQSNLDDQIMMLKSKLAVMKSVEVANRDTISSAPVSNGENPYEGIDYFDFENHFRGSTKVIKERQAQYIKYFVGHSNVIDIGCGRGEFLELLKDNSIDSQGVDLYPEFVEMCRQKGLNAYNGDGIEFLGKQNNVGGIFGAQIIEHLSMGQITHLCKLAYEKLEEGGCIILETPNPRCLSIFANSFYMDPSHNKPVHPEVMKYVLEKAGFKNIDVIYTAESRCQDNIPKIQNIDNCDEFNNALEKVNELMFGSQDYAIVGVK